MGNTNTQYVECFGWLTVQVLIILVKVLTYPFAIVQLTAIG